MNRVTEGIFASPRPIPGRLVPAISGAAVVVLALPVILIAGWSVRGWALAAVLWLGATLFALLLTRLPLGTGNLAAAGMRGIGTSMRAFLVGVPLVAITVADERLGLTAAIVYALAYTVELAVGILSYFSGEAKTS